jgi:hypothetical protein
MYNQEESNQLFPLEEIPLSERRYSVGWYHEDTREFILVYDRLNRHVVFKSNTAILYDKEGNVVLDEKGRVLTRQKQYCHIKKFYGERDCEPPKQINPVFYEGL